MSVFPREVSGEPECIIQPLTRRLARSPSGEPDPPAVRVFWWFEINHRPFQLLTNPELDYRNATNLPLLFAPPDSHIEPQMDPPTDWRGMVESLAPLFIQRDVSPVVFMSRRRDMWIPNPLIGLTDTPELQPKILSCLAGKMLVRYQGLETECDESIELPTDGRFFLKFREDSLFVLGFLN